MDLRTIDGYAEDKIMSIAHCITIGIPIV